MPRSRLALAGAAAVALSCVDKPLPTVSTVAPSTYNLTARLQANQVVGAASIDVRAGYARTSGGPLFISQQQVAVGSGTQTLSLGVDLAPCIADPAHVGLAEACPLVVGVVARNASGAGIDSMLAGPFSVTPGRATAPLDILLSLSEFTTIAIGASITIAAPPSIPGVSTGTLSFASSDTLIATVSSSGLVTTKSIGLVTISATLGQQTVATRLQVSPLATNSLAVGDAFACALTVTGAAHCWGADTVGQLGNGGSAASAVPVAVSGGLTFKQIGAQGRTACGLTVAGKVYCWGLFFGSPNREPRLMAEQQFQSVSVGFPGVCALTSAGKAYCGGFNSLGALGTGDTVSTTGPVAVSGGVTFAGIDMGLVNTCGYTAAGSVYCWGSNQFRSLGVSGSLGAFTTPTLVPGNLAFKSVSTGATTTCAIVTTGAGYCWGTSFYGSLGDGSASTSLAALSPSPLAGGLTWRMLSTGKANYIYTVNCGLATDFSAYCWGANLNGAIGTSTTLPFSCTGAGTGAPTFRCTTTPSAVSTSLRFQTVSVGADNVCGITTIKTLVCWGNNASGQLGDGTTINRPTPVAVTGNLKLP